MHIFLSTDAVLDRPAFRNRKTFLSGVVTAYAFCRGERSVADVRQSLGLADMPDKLERTLAVSASRWRLTKTAQKIGIGIKR